MCIHVCAGKKLHPRNISPVSDSLAGDERARRQQAQRSIINRNAVSIGTILLAVIKTVDSSCKKTNLVDWVIHEWERDTSCVFWEKGATREFGWNRHEVINTSFTPKCFQRRRFLRYLLLLGKLTLLVESRQLLHYHASALERAEHRPVEVWQKLTHIMITYCCCCYFSFMYRSTP